jgi:TetR/AcrR family transcriptional repressor of nem operon
MSRNKYPQLTRRKIIQAAAEEFLAKGFTAASVDNILQKTGLTKGALYYHFGTKAELGYAVVEEVFEGLVREEWLEPLTGVDDPLTRLGELIAGICEKPSPEEIALGCPITNLALEMSAVDEGFRRRINWVYDRWRRGLARALRLGQTKGTVREDVDAVAVATFLVGSVSGCRGLAKNAQSQEILALAGGVLRDYLETLRPPSGPAAGPPPGGPTFKTYRKTGC